MGTDETYEPTYTVPTFCEAEHISEFTYGKLRSMGLNPKELRYPGMSIVRITHAERLAWQQRMLNLTGEHAEAVQRTNEHMRQKGRSAAIKSVASPLHVSNRRRRGEFVPPRKRGRRRATAAE